jgi:hypothetical protein
MIPMLRVFSRETFLAVVVIACSPQSESRRRPCGRR